MKTQEEIQRAHDILHAVLEYDTQQPKKMPVSLSIPVNATHDTLAWVLEGPCRGEAFEENLAMLQAKMKAAGYHFVKREGEGHSE